MYFSLPLTLGMNFTVQRRKGFNYSHLSNSKLTFHQRVPYLYTYQVQVHGKGNYITLQSSNIRVEGSLVN